MTTNIPDSTSRPNPIVLFLGSGLLSGYSPIASGTVGSAVALAIYLLVPGFDSPYVIMSVTAACFLFGISASEKMESFYGNDPAEVTIDEMVGMWMSLMLLPFSTPLAVLGFFIFRVLDIVKPFPAKRFEQQKGGFGIMMDDVVAGVYTNLILHMVAAIMQFSGI